MRSIPDEVETLILPAGSCNTTISVLYGIARFRPKGLRRIILVGVAPPRIEWMEERLLLVQRQSGVDIAGLFHRKYPEHPELAARFNQDGGSLAYALHYLDLHTTGFATWETLMPASYEGVHLHPSYEGKLMTFMRARPDLFDVYVKSGRTLFWVVGSAPSWGPMAANVPRGDELPT